MSSLPAERLRDALAKRYAIQQELGSGGMATVYLADDLKHHRRVAVKVLRPELAEAVGGDRFLREIDIVARLSHPHILPLYDSGQVKGFLYYVMPYVEGESLRERLARVGELPIDEVVRILRDVVDALSYAHSQGVVHRDIKPDNVLLSFRHALVADFGVARAVSAATGRQWVTTAGVALGTPAYMAPEQATGEAHLDQRVDIYAVGALAYELLAGRTVFDAPTAQGMLAAHVTEVPDPVTKYRPTIPPALADLVMKCLAKKPADRWQSADELLSRLEAFTTPGGGTTPVGTGPLAASAKGFRRPRALVAAIAAVVTIGGGVALLVARRMPAAVTLGRNMRITDAPGLELDPAISPDGKLIAYAAGPLFSMHIFVRQIGAERTIDVTQGLAGSHRSPQWSPDGTEVMFVTRELERATINVVPALGGTARRLLDVPERSAAEELRSPTWSPDARAIAYAQGPAIYLRLLNGDARKLLETTQPHSLAWSPDGRWIAYVSGNSGFLLPPKSGYGAWAIGNIAPSGLWIVPAAGGLPVEVAHASHLNLSPLWTPDGRSLLFVSDRDGSRDLYEVHLAAGGKPQGPPVRLTTGLTAQTVSVSWGAGTLAYSVFSNRANIWSIAMPNGGPVSVGRAGQLTTGNIIIEEFSISTDGRWLAYSTDRGGNSDIYRLPLSGGEAQQVTTDPADDFTPSWSPDGKELAFHSLRRGNRDIYTISVDGEPAHQVTHDPREERRPDWSPDGNHLVFVREVEDRGDLFVTSRMDRSSPWSEARRLTTDGGDVPKWSPARAEIAYIWAGVLKVIPAEGGRARVLVGGTGSATKLVPIKATWSGDGRTIYYAARDVHGGGGIFSVGAEGGPPRLLVTFDDPSKPFYRSLSTDGKRFFLNISQQESDIWVAEVRGRK